MLLHCTNKHKSMGTDSRLVNRIYLINQVKGSVFNGLYNPNTTLSDITASCESGNCTLPVHFSLAICASTVDVTPLLQKSCSQSDQTQCNYTLPSGDPLAGPNDVISLLTTSSPSLNSIALPTQVRSSTSIPSWSPIKPRNHCSLNPRSTYAFSSTSPLSRAGRRSPTNSDPPSLISSVSILISSPYPTILAPIM